MTCSDCTAAIVEMARQTLDDAVTGEARAHLRTCSRCRTRLVRERTLSSALRTLRERARGETPSAAVETSLRLTFEAEQMRRSPQPQAPLSTTTRASGSRGLAAAAALVLLVGWLLLWQRHELAHTPPSVPDPAGSEFVEWPGASSLPALESGQLVRTELPASVLPLLGLISGREITTDMVAADVVVGQDGLARAVRLAPVSVHAMQPLRETQ